MIKVKPRYGKTATCNTLSWYCRNFNILTTSQDREKCIKNHLEKLKKYGFIRSSIPFTEYDCIAMEFCKHPFREK